MAIDYHHFKNRAFAPCPLVMVLGGPDFWARELDMDIDWVVARGRA